MNATLRQSITIKLMFLLAYAAAASWLAYFYVYLKEVPKLSSIEVGLIAGIQQFNYVFVLPVWGILADKIGRKNTLLASIGLTLLLVLCFLWLHSAISIFLLVFVLTFFYNPISSLLDTVALDYEEQTHGQTSYGELRLWASMGWASSSFLTGIFINNSKLSLIFPVATSIFLVAWILIFFIYKPLKITKNLSSLKPVVIKDILTSEKALLRFFILIFFYSLFTAPIYLMLNIYYHEIGAPSSIIGLALAVQSISELPFFFYGKKLVNKFGALNIFIFTMAATSLRMLAYGLTSNPNYAIVIGLIHGISIGLFFVSMVAFVHKIVPAHLRSTGQSLIYSFYSGGVAFGNLLTGIFDDFISIKIAMLINAGAVGLLVLFVLARRKYLTKKAAFR